MVKMLYSDSPKFDKEHARRWVRIAEQGSGRCRRAKRADDVVANRFTQTESGYWSRVHASRISNTPTIKACGQHEGRRKGSGEGCTTKESGRKVERTGLKMQIVLPDSHSPGRKCIFMLRETQLRRVCYVKCCVHENMLMYALALKHISKQSCIIQRPPRALACTAGMTYNADPAAWLS
jgi:hypothetical protein